jgi:hypothetical protein
MFAFLPPPSQQQFSFVAPLVSQSFPLHDVTTFPHSLPISLRFAKGGKKLKNPLFTHEIQKLHQLHGEATQPQHLLNT